MKVNFPTGKCVITPGAVELLGRAGRDPVHYIDMHVGLIQGQLCDDDHALNVHAVKNGLRVLSRFEVVTDEFIYVITEADRSTTIILLPSEY
jgi:hypothetical protein